MRHGKIILACAACILLLWGCAQEKEEGSGREPQMEETEPREEPKSQEESGPQQENENADADTDTKAWRDVYAAYLELMGGGEEGNLHEFSFSLIYVNDDNIPELVCDSGIEAGGCLLLTCKDGKIDTFQTNRLYFDYIEKGNLLCNSEGHMGYYYDLVYKIRDGKWEFVAKGEYQDPNGEYREDEDGNPVYQYYWAEKEVSKEDYEKELKAVYDKDNARTPAVYYDMDEILSVLWTGHHSSAFHTYELVMGNMTWQEARAECEARGGYLATITSAEERETIEAQIEKEGKTGVTFYVGANNGKVDGGSYSYSWLELGRERRNMPYQVYNGFWAQNGDSYLEPSYRGQTEDGREVEEEYVVLMYTKAKKRYYLYDVPNDILDAAPSYEGNIGYICEYDR